MRIPFVGGNWKCNGTKKSVFDLVNILNNSNDFNNVDIICAPTSLHLDYVVNNLRSDFKLAIQNICSYPNSGAYTGELTPDIVKDFGIDWAIVGHSERRHKIASESDKILYKKTKSCISKGLKVIFCIGEVLQERKDGLTLEICKQHLQLLVNSLTKEEWKNIVIAYEPVWAIGTGETASPEQAEEVHSNIRQWLFDNIGDTANSIRIIYGGSVKPNNCKNLYNQPNIDGFLIGGCSLNSDFLKIINYIL